jgi:hypothetical protein
VAGDGDGADFDGVADLSDIDASVEADLVSSSIRPWLSRRLEAALSTPSYELTSASTVAVTTDGDRTPDSTQASADVHGRPLSCTVASYLAGRQQFWPIGQLQRAQPRSRRVVGGVGRRPRPRPDLAPQPHHLVRLAETSNEYPSGRRTAHSPNTSLGTRCGPRRVTAGNGRERQGTARTIAGTLPSVSRSIGSAPRRPRSHSPGKSVPAQSGAPLRRPSAPTPRRCTFSGRDLGIARRDADVLTCRGRVALPVGRSSRRR